MTKSVVLWNFYRSSASWRVRIALNLKGVDYVYRSVNLMNNEQYTEKFLQMNPKQEIPLLQIDGTFLTQSIPMIEYIDETRPQGASLFPKDPVSKAKARALAEIINSGIQPYQNTNVQKRVNQWFGEEKKTEWLQHYLHKGFRVIEESLKESSGKYCIGDSISIADLCLVPQIYAAGRFNVGIQKYENISRISQTLAEIPEFRKAHPNCQPDTPPELRGRSWKCE